MMHVAMEALKNKEEAAEALKQYAHKTALMGATVAARNKAALEAEQKLKDKYQPVILTLSNELTEIEKRLEEWATSNRRTIFGEEQSLEFSYGFLKFRLGQRKLVMLARWTEEKVLKALLAFPVTSQWQEYIRREPEIDKRKLLEATKDGGKLPEAKLREIGLRVTRDEKFSIETKPEMVAKDCDLMP